MSQNSGINSSSASALGDVIMKIKLLVLVLLLLFGSSVAHACTCGRSGSPTEDLRKHRAVFVGEVISVSQPIPKKLRNSKGRVYEIRPLIEIRLRVLKAWKGVDRQTFVVQTNIPDGGSCGWTLREGQSYLVYAYGKLLMVSQCSRTTLLDDAQDDIRELDHMTAQAQRK